MSFVRRSWRLLACFVLLGSSLGCAHRASVTHTTATPFVRTTIRPPVTPATAPPCEPRHLSLRDTHQFPGDTEDRGTTIEVHSNDESPCELEGSPKASLKDSAGNWIAVPTDAEAHAVPVTNADHALMDRERPAYVRLRQISSCADGLNEGPPFFTTLRLTIAGRDLAVAIQIAARCNGTSISPFY